jgi:O-antigen/teichoic acid export membrane protein
VRVLLQRFVGFSAVPLLAFVAPLFLLPIVSRLAGVDGWAAIGTAQAVGALCAMVASFGWNVNGGALIALAEDDAERRALYADSFWSRLICFVLVGGGGAILSAALVGAAYAPLAALVTVATGVASLTLTWFGVGTGSARTILYFETIPVTVAVIIAVPLLLLTQNLFFYPVLLLLGSLTGLLLLHLSMYRRPVPPWDHRRLARALRSNLAIAAADGAGGSYTSAPIPVAQSLSGPAAAAELTSADKVYRLALVAVTILGNTLQKWVLEVDYAEGRLRRHLVSLSLHAALALVGAVLLVTAGPFVTTVALGSEVAAGAGVFVGYAITFAIICLTTPLIRNVLVPAGRNRTVLAAIVGAAAVGLPLMIIWGPLGPQWVVAGLAASELVVLAVTGTAAVGVLRRESRGARRDDSPGRTA